MSLSSPHLLWSTAANAYDVNKGIIQSRLLSGRYRLGSLLRHFSPSNSGECELCGHHLEDLPHFLVPRCPQLQERRTSLLTYWFYILEQSDNCSFIVHEILESEDDNLLVQFVLDCSVLPQVILASQDNPNVLPLLFKITRTWVYSLHRTRLKLMNIWKQV